MVATTLVVYVLDSLLSSLVIPEIGRRFTSKLTEKGARLKDVKGPKWLKRIGERFDAIQINTTEKVEARLNELQKNISEALKHEGEIKDENARLILESINDLKDRIDNQQLTNDDKEFFAEIKKNFDLDEFEKRVEEILKENVGVDKQLFQVELTTFFKNMGWDDIVDDIKKIAIMQKDLLKGQKEIKKCIKTLTEKIVQTDKLKRIKLIYKSDPTPDVSKFLGRKIQLKKLRESLDKTNMVIIQGIPGIGKTQLAAKLKENIEKDYTTFWYSLSGSDTFDSVVRQLAVFLREKENPELADYIESGGDDRETIMGLLLNGLKNKNYVIFFDDYHKVADYNQEKNQEIHILFWRFRDRLKGPTFIITTRIQPQFVDSTDSITKVVLEGFEYGTTKEYLEREKVKVTPEQLKKLQKMLSGHPLLLSLFAPLAKKGEIELSEILEKLLKEREMRDLFLKNFYDLLKEYEQKVLEAMSVFREGVPLEACLCVVQGEKVKKILMDLEEEKLVNKRGELYEVHDLMRDSIYSNRLDSPKKYHQLVGEYYKQLEKTPKNILETVHHLIKVDGSINDEIVDYLKDTPKNPDTIISYIVLDLLEKNEITSPKIFGLLEEFVIAPDLTVQKLFINEYSNLFRKIRQINNKKSIDVLRKILDQADYTSLVQLTRTISKISDEIPDEAPELWKNIIDNGDKIVHDLVSFGVPDLKLDVKEKVRILKYLIERSDKPDTLWYAKTALKNWGFLETEEMTCDDHLDKLRNMSTDEKFLYIKQIKDKVEAYFTLEILENIYLQNTDQTAEVLKSLVKSRYHDPVIMQRIPRLVAKLAKEDIKYLRFFLTDHENNEYLKFVGIRALDILKYEIEEDIYALLAPMEADKSPVIREMASILREEKKTITSVKETSQEKSRIDLKSIFGSLKNVYAPIYLIKIFTTDLSSTEPLAFLTACWGVQKAVEGTDLAILSRILKPLNKYDNKSIRNAYIQAATVIQEDPSMFLKISNIMLSNIMLSNIALKFTLEQKMSAVWLICNVGNLAPEKAIKYLEPLKNTDNPLLCMHLLHSLKYLRDEWPDETKAFPDKTKPFFESLSNHENGDVRGLAKLLLNGV